MSVVPGFQRQIFKHVKILSKRSKEMKEQKKNKTNVLVAESAYHSQNAQAKWPSNDCNHLPDGSTGHPRLQTLHLFHQSMTPHHLERPLRIGVHPKYLWQVICR